MSKNRKLSYCCWCSNPIDIGQGNLFHVGEEDENLGFGPIGATGWMVSCLDKTACNERREEHKRERQATIIEVRRIASSENIFFPTEKEFHAGFPEKGQLPFPEGTKYERPGLGFTVYGGGTQYVVTNQNIWKLVNNGGDGDAWDCNNVRTGGAGAIGYIYPATSEPLTFLGLFAENITEKEERETKKEKEREEKENARIKAGLTSMLARGITWSQIKASLKKPSSTFCPKELQSESGKPTVHLTLAEAQEIINEHP